jgi:hypothetical protein
MAAAYLLAIKRRPKEIMQDPDNQFLRHCRA